MSTNIWVISININGVNADRPGNTFSDLLDRFNKSKYHGMLVQEPRYSTEAHSKSYNWETIAQLKKITCIISNNQQGVGGVATFWKNSFTQQTAEFSLTQVVEGEAQLTTFQFNMIRYSFCNIYADSHSGQKRSTLFKKLKELLPVYTFVAGDFNQVRDVNVDIWRVNGQNSLYDNTGWASCTAMMQKLAIHDGWRDGPGQQKLYFTKHTKQYGRTTCDWRPALACSLSSLEDTLGPMPASLRAKLGAHTQGACLPKAN